MTNHERANRLLSEARAIAEEMHRALVLERWNLAARRAQEVVELVVKGLLNEIGVEYPRIHDAAPVLVEELQRRQLETEPGFSIWLGSISRRLAELRGPAFYHEVELRETDAREAVTAADRLLAAGQTILARLREGG